MRTVFRNHAEVCHKWASQSQDEGRAGNISFRGRTINSYGYWPMASFDADDPNVVLYRDGSCSNSTSKHQSLVRCAVSHCKLFTVISGYGGSKPNHDKNIANYRLNMRVAADKFWNSRGGYYYYEDTNYEHITKEARQYAEYYGVKLPALFGLELSGEKAKQKHKELRAVADNRAEQNRLQKERRDTAKLKAQPELDRLQAEYERSWLDGFETAQLSQRVEIDGYTFYAEQFSQTRVRLSKDGKEVETTMGARVSIRAAEILYRMIVAGKPVHGHVIDGYTVIGYNGALKIGCHEIKRNEIDRFAKVINW